MILLCLKSMELPSHVNKCTTPQLEEAGHSFVSVTFLSSDVIWCVSSMCHDNSTLQKASGTSLRWTGGATVGVRLRELTRHMSVDKEH